MLVPRQKGHMMSIICRKNVALHKAMIQAKKYVKDIASETGLDKNTVYRAKRGLVINIETAKLIAHSLGVQVYDIFSEAQQSDERGRKPLSKQSETKPKAQSKAEKICPQCHIVLPSTGRCFDCEDRV